MVLSRKVKNPARAVHPRQDNFQYGHFFGQPAYAPPSKELDDGIRAIVESMKSGALSEDKGSELIRILLAAYLEALISRRVADYLERGVVDTLIRQIESGDSGGRRE